MKIAELTWLFQGVITGIAIAVVVGLFAEIQRRRLRRRQIADLRSMLLDAHEKMKIWDRDDSPQGTRAPALKAIYTRMLSLLKSMLSRPDLQLTYTQGFGLQTLVEDARRIFDFGIQGNSLSHYNDVFFDKVRDLKWLGFRVDESQ